MHVGIVKQIDESRSEFQIRDGNTESSPLINKYCGENRPPTIVSTHNFLWIKMVTDKDVEMRGFYANYTTVDICWCFFFFFN